MVVDGSQDVAMAFEPGEEDVLQHRPRSPSDGIISPPLWGRPVLSALITAMGTLLMFRGS